jgi:hypothetical protein
LTTFLDEASLREARFEVPRFEAPLFLDEAFLVAILFSFTDATKRGLSFLFSDKEQYAPGSLR